MLYAMLYRQFEWKLRTIVAHEGHASGLVFVLSTKEGTHGVNNPSFCPTPKSFLFSPYWFWSYRVCIGFGVIELVLRINVQMMVFCVCRCLAPSL